jgi:nucleoside-diphosphate-sugar epimerase
MKTLLTGPAGFIGIPLCKRLLADTFLVSGTVRSEKSKKRLPPGVIPVPLGAIGPDTDWSEALKNIDTVIHLAARVHVMHDNAADPLAEFRSVNVSGTEHLARMAAATEVKRFIFLSSVKVHGEETAKHYLEETPPAPKDPYAVSKVEAEVALKKVADETGLEVVVIRPPLVYGPGVKANFLKIMHAIQRGTPLPLASISNRRSLIYVGNLVDAIASCCTHPKAAGQTYLVSDGEDVSTPDLVRRIAEAMDTPARIFPFPPGLIRLAGRLTGKSSQVDRLLGSLTVDSSKIRRELSWQPPYTMEHGLKETAEWFKGILNDG